MRCKIKLKKQKFCCSKCVTPMIKDGKWYCPVYKIFLYVEGLWLINNKDREELKE
jgi:uncharacterized Zn finger protein (UPF0148 family)